MKDFRGQEPIGIINLGEIDGPYYVDLDQSVEYWHTGKLYRLGSEARIERFIRLLGIQNEIDNADVAVGPAYIFFDDQGQEFDTPMLDLEIGHIGIYHAVGDVGATFEVKKELYRKLAHDWDGVPQIPLWDSKAEH